MKKIIPFCVFLMTLMPLCCLAQFIGPVGARAVGMAGCVPVSADAFSVFNNIGALGALEQAEGALFVANRFGLSEFSTVAAAVAMPARYIPGNAGFGVLRFGSPLYSESRLGIAYGHQIEQFCLGVQAEWLQVNIQDYGSRNAVSINFGGMARLSPQISLGAHLYNLNQAKLAPFTDERLPTTMKTGLQYQPFKALSVNAQIQKSTYRKIEFLAAVEYEIVAKMRLRTGINMTTKSGYGGADFRSGPFAMGYAAGFQTGPGYTHSLSLHYFFPIYAPTIKNKNSH